MCCVIGNVLHTSLGVGHKRQLSNAANSQAMTVWTIANGGDQIVARLIPREESPGLCEVRLSCFHSRILPTLEEAGAEVEFLQIDYLGRGWVVVAMLTICRANGWEH